MSSHSICFHLYLGRPKKTSRSKTLIPVWVQGQSKVSYCTSHWWSYCKSLYCTNSGNFQRMRALLCLTQEWEESEIYDGPRSRREASQIPGSAARSGCSVSSPRPCPDTPSLHAQATQHPGNKINVQTCTNTSLSHDLDPPALQSCTQTS